MINLGRGATININPDIKPPQRVDVLALPTYKEAAKMDAESPPAYTSYLSQTDDAKILEN